MGLLGDLTNVGFDSVQAKILATAIGGGGGGSVTWGNIGGTLSNQTDLQNALNAKANLSSLALVATSGSYNDLSDKPTIPTVNNATLTIQKNSSNVGTFTANASSNVTIDISVPTDTNDLTNGAGYITSGDIPSGDLSSNSSVLTVTDGTGATLSNTSLTLDTDLSKYDNTTSDFVDSGDLATKQDVIDNNNPLSASYVSGLATVATSGDYTDLLNKPTIPTVNDATLTIQRNSTNVGTFTANASSNATIDITVPTDTNDLTNGAGYITSSSLPTVNDATLTIQKNGTNVATFTANASSNATANISVPTDTSDLTNTAGYITGVSSINDIGDVTITTPSAGELLKYDGSKWINGSPSVTVTNWGDILGILSNQTDLQNALNDKQDVIDANNKLDYSLLSNTPTIPTVNDATLTIQKNSSNVGTFTANASSNATIDITVPTDTGDLTNGAGFIDSSIFSSNNTWTGTNTFSGLTLAGNITPNANNTYKLGDTNAFWSQLYARKIYTGSGTGIYFSTGEEQSYVKDVTGNTLELHATASINLKAGDSIRIRCGTTTARPETNNAYDLGDSNHRWRTIYSVNPLNTSDRRIKDNIEDLENGLEKINSIAVKSYTINNHNEGVMYGFIAQDELERNPELVVVPDNYSEEENGGELGYMPNNVLFLAVKAIQELSDKVTNLEQELKTIKGDSYGN